MPRSKNQSNHSEITNVNDVEDEDDDIPLQKYREKLILNINNVPKTAEMGCGKTLKKMKKRTRKKTKKFTKEKFSCTRNNLISSDTGSDVVSDEEPSTEQLRPVHYYQIKGQQETKHSRKRKRSSDGWHRKKSKQSRAKGEAYINAKGVLVSGKQPSLDSCLCADKCRQKCSGKFSSDERERVFEAFYALDEDGKNCLIFSCISPFKPMFIRAEVHSHRSVSFRYSIVIGSEKKFVCKGRWHHYCKFLCPKLIKF